MRYLRRSIVVCLAVVATLSAACANPEVAKQRYLASGDKYMAENKVAEAIVEYRNAIRQDPRFGQARWKLAEAYAKAQNAQAAFREFVRAADLLPDNTHVQLTAGNYLLVAKQFEEAKVRAEKVLAREPRNVDALILQANALASLKDVDGAIREIEEALAVEPDSRMYTNLGALQVVQGNAARAEQAFKKALELSPNEVAPLLAIANFYVATRRAADAEAALKQAVTIDPKHAMANRMLGALYILTRRAPQAEAPLKAAAESADPASRLALADYYVLSARPGDAIALLKTLAADKMLYAPATKRLAQIEYGQGHHDQARRILDELLAKQPTSGSLLALKSRWQMAAADVNGAFESARAATEAEPGLAEAHLALGNAQVAKGERDAAIAEFTEVLRLNPKVVSAQLQLSRLQLRNGNVEAAVRFAQQARQADPNNPDAQLALARGFLIQNNAVAAEPEVRALLKLHPSSPATHSVHGWLLLNKKDRNGAREAFQRSLAIDPTYPEALQGMLQVDRLAGTLPAAVARLDAAIEKEPRNAAVLMVGARTYYTAKETEKAEATLRRVIEVAPDHLPAYVMLGQMLVAQKRLDDARVQYEAIAARQPKHVGAATMVAIILQLQNKQGEAQKKYEEIIASNPAAPVAANNLAWMYTSNGGSLDTALQLAQRAKSQLPAVAEVNDTLGWVYYKKNLPSLAIGPLEESVSKAPDNASYHLHLGLAYAKNGQTDKARATLQRALKMDAHVEGADEAREALAKLPG